MSTPPGMTAMVLPGPLSAAWWAQPSAPKAMPETTVMPAAESSSATAAVKSSAAPEECAEKGGVAQGVEQGGRVGQFLQQRRIAFVGP